MIVLPYTVSLALFYLAWFLIVRRIPTPPSVTWLSAALFFVSFSTNSLLVFYVVPIAHLWWITESHNWVGIKSFVRSKWILLLPPVIFGVLRYTVLLPTAGFEGYNTLQFGPMVQAASFLVLAALALGTILPLTQRKPGNPWLSRVAVPGALGLLLIMVAAFPYWAVGHLPPWWGWLSRDQLLMPLGAAVMALAAVRGIRLILGPKMARFAAASLIALSVLGANWISYRYWLDWQKQSSLLEALADVPEIADAPFVVLDDQAADYNIFGDPYKYYVQGNIFKYVFGGSRVVVNEGPEVDQALNNQLVLAPALPEGTTRLDLTLLPKETGRFLGLRLPPRIILVPESLD